MIYRLLYFFLKLLSYIPLRVLYVLSDGLFYLLYYLVRYRRKIVRRNLTESFPGKSLPEIRKIEKKFYRFFADTIFEICKMPSMSLEEISRRMKFTNVETINAILKQGKTVSVYMGHYGNWEWVTFIPLYLEKEIVAAQIYRKLRNKSMDKLMSHNRERMGSVCVEMRKTARYINEMAAHHKAGIIGFVADQSPRKREVRHFVQFLHHKTPVLTGTEKITKHYGFEAWYLNIKRVKRGYYEAEFIQIHENPQSLPDFELTALYYQLLEQAILRQPELYLWTHNRFKHAQKSDT
ncbi:lysophospholipid acyltransferase family protein [Bacteroides sp. UBA939]|uniref:lysophospholipid acyltransferase family protein n=1 Tax=Bacteroides sp. UBA939 TaxID=1946092 RepID=UPI0025B97E68|nr:lysophospholipid acyltransferase family protein [Bacteroides sp. UBA939]